MNQQKPGAAIRLSFAPPLLYLLLAACTPTLPAGRPPAEAAGPPAASGALPEAPDAALASVPAPPDPALLLGLEPRVAQIALGPPNLVRKEGSAQVMQFTGGGCVLDIFFYEEAVGGAFLSRYLASRAANGTPLDSQDCLTALLPDGRFPAGLFPDAVDAPNPGAAEDEDNGTIP